MAGRALPPKVILLDCPTIREARRRCAWCAIRLLIATCTAAVTIPGSVQAQVASTDASETVYWRQNLFSIPYQWSSNANQSAPHSVWLYVSKDRGTTWQQVGDAQPQLLAFNYRAEADGEYWFAIRTTDASGRDTRSSATNDPAAAMQPELRVIVDTVMPRFEGLQGVQRSDSTLEVRWRVADANLLAHSCSVEVQNDSSDDWQPVPLASALATSLGVWEGLATINIAPNTRRTAVRATVIDLAGNRAVYQSAIATVGNELADAGPAIPSGRSSAPAVPAPSMPGWVANSAPSIAADQQNRPAQPQIWPADRVERGGTALSEGSYASITYGTPVGFENTSTPTDDSDEPLDLPTPETEDRPLGNIPAQSRKNFEPLEPFRQVSTNRQVAPAHAPSPTHSFAPAPSPTPRATLVNSRSFELEYELADVGEHGVTKVELWGTRDGGATWQSFAVDDDNRSPLKVTVDGAGDYGFSIVVCGADKLGGFPPHPGDKPELWVGVDLEPPQAQLLSVNGNGIDAADQLMVRWEADDDNLEPRPIALFYSSRPAGPWTAIATSLENVGEYVWSLERYVPRSVYLKLEARDTAGNVAVYQTHEPVAVESAGSAARIQRLPPL